MESHKLNVIMKARQDLGRLVQGRSEEEFCSDDWYDEDDAYTMADEGELAIVAAASSEYSDQLGYPTGRNDFTGVSFRGNDTDIKLLIVSHILISRLSATQAISVLTNKDSQLEDAFVSATVPAPNVPKTPTRSTPFGSSGRTVAVRGRHGVCFAILL